MSPSAVRWVVLTHLHTDHAGGLAHFPNAEILVTRTEYEGARGARGKLNGYLPHRWPEWLSPTLVDFPDEPFGPFPASRALTSAGDVRLLQTAGHTPGHMSVVLREPEGRLILFAGDTSYTQDLMRRGAVDGVSPDVEAATTTLDRIRELASTEDVVYLPTHDPESARRLAARETVPR